MSETSDLLLKAIRDAQPDLDSQTALATVTGGNASGYLVLFDGEASASTRRYLAVTGAVVGDRVVMLKVGSTWILLGSVQGQGNVGSVAINGLVGPWGTAVPTATQGAVFSVAQPGIMRGTAHCTAYNAAGNAQIAVQVWIDGVQRADMILGTAAPTGVHTALGAGVFAIPITAGTHYLYLRQFSGNSNADDNAQMFAVVTPT